MNKEQKTLSESVKAICGEVVFNDDRLFAFGKDEYDDLLVTTRLKKPIPKLEAASLTNVKVKTQKEYQSLFKRASELLDQGAIASFNITASLKKKIDAAIDKMNATNIRLHSNRDGIYLALFDLRRFDPQYRISRKSEVMLVTEKISTQSNYNFSVSLLAQSFRKLPVTAYSVVISPNGTVHFTNDSDMTYILRDQNVAEPLHSFVSEQPAKDTSFWLHPKIA